MLTKKVWTMAIAIPMAVAIGFGGYNVSNNQNHSMAADNKVPQTILISKDFSLTSSFEEMVNQSDLVVIGEYKNFDSKWNMARDPYNPLEEDTENYVEGHLYNFKISETIKGTAVSKIVKVNHRYAESFLLEESNAVVAEDGIILKEATKVVTKKVENKDPLYIEPTLGKKYMLFLKEGETLGNYYGAIEPFSISFDKNNKAELDSNLKTINDDLLTSTIQFDGSEYILKNEIHETITDTISGRDLKELKEQVQKKAK